MGIYLLASQAVDKCQSQEGAEAALQDIEGYLETAAHHKLTNAEELHKQFELFLTSEIRVNLSSTMQNTIYNFLQSSINDNKRFCPKREYSLLIITVN